MKNLGKYSILILTILLGCLETFDPDISGEDVDFLVVDGMITDDIGPYTVKITKAGSLTSEEDSISVNNIQIEVSDGHMEELVEVSKGVYQTTSLQGEVGKSYMLSFDYAGESFQSTWETISASSELDSIYHEIETMETADPDVDEVGLQFYVSNQGSSDGSRYFRYEYQETWQVEPLDLITYDYVGEDSVIFTTSDLPLVCWKDITSSEILLATTETFSENRLAGHKLVFLSGNDNERRFNVRHRILVKQYTIDQNEYIFWKGIRQSNDEIGGVFDQQPAQVTGNMSSIGESDNLVLGYFSACGYKEKLLYTDSDEVRHEAFFVSCTAFYDILKEDFDLPQDYEERAKQPYFYHFIEGDGGQILGVRQISPFCVDCSFAGRDTVRPDFWLDE